MCTLKRYAVKGCTIYSGTTCSGVLNRVYFTNKKGFIKIYLSLLLSSGANPVSLPPKNQNELYSEHLNM